MVAKDNATFLFFWRAYRTLRPHSCRNLPASIGGLADLIVSLIPFRTEAYSGVALQIRGFGLDAVFKIVEFPFPWSPKPNG